MNVFKKIWARVTSTGRYIIGPRRPFFSRGGVVVNEDSAMKVAAYYRGLMYLSTQIAKLPWELKDKDNNIVTDGNLPIILGLAPNPETNAFMFRLFLVQQALNYGNAYAEIERDGAGRPVYMWQLESSRMELARTTDGKLVYIYHDPEKGDIYFPPRDIYHIRNFHTKDGLVGQGLVAYGSEVLGIQIGADTMAGGMFYNSGIPSAILEHPGKLSPEAYKRLKDSWDEQEGGKKSGSTSILEEGMKYVPIKVDPNALQFLESRKFGIVEISRFLGVPPTKMFDTTAATFDNVENSNLEVTTDTLDAWTSNLEMEADVKLLNFRYGGRYTELDLYAVFRGDMESRSKYFKDMFSLGAITPNQIRAKEGQPGYGPKGDKYYIANNNFVPVDRLDEVIDADIKSKNKPAATPAEPKNKEPTPLEQAALDYLNSNKS